MITLTVARKQMSYLWMLLLTAVLLMISVQSAALRQVLWERILLCLQTLIPSLFGGMAICNLLMHTGALETLGGLCKGKRKKKNGIGALVAVYLLSQLAGYPMGAMLLRTMEEQGQISRSEAERFSYVCFGAGPSFLIGMAGGQLLGSAKAGWLLFGCCMLGNLLLALWTFRRTESQFHITETHQTYTISEAMVLSAQQAMDGLMRICAVILLFGVIWFLAEHTGIVGLLCGIGEQMGIDAEVTKAVLAAACDVTQLGNLCSAGMSRNVLLPVMAAMLSFGGFCVHSQCAAVGVHGLSYGKLVAVRLISALISGVLCAIISPLFPPSAAVDVFSTQMAMSKTGSFLPGLLILCTGFPLILKKDWTK